jgi:hypothetical protein
MTFPQVEFTPSPGTLPNGQPATSWHTVFIRQVTKEKVDAFLTPVRDHVIVLTVGNGPAHN